MNQEPHQSADTSYQNHGFSERLGRLAVFCYQRRALYWLGLLLARMHKGHHAGLMDKSAAHERSSKPLGWYWLSFVEPSAADGQRFLGVAIVEGHGVSSAAIRAHDLEINPGGEVQAVELIGNDIPPPEMRNRLLSREELSAAALI